MGEEQGIGGDAARQRLTRAEVDARHATLEPGWTLAEEGTALVREFPVKGFAKAVYLANLAAFLADSQRHHPDITFGVGYCRLRYTTHDVNGLSALDFAAAAAFDRLRG